MRVYIASSWRNTRYDEVCAAVRAAGHDVMDWRATGLQLPNWGIADERFAAATERSKWFPELAREALAHPRVRATFRKYMDLLYRADVLVLLTPCGRSAHFEAGFAMGRSMPCALLLTDGVEPELMTADMTSLVSVEGVVSWLSSIQSITDEWNEAEG
jgi:hypothetical protein